MDVLTDIECGIDISLNSTECVLTGSWPQIVRAKELIEKRFTSTTIVRGSGSSSELSEEPQTAQDPITARDVVAQLSGIVETEDISSELAIGPSPKNMNVKLPERFGDSGKESPTLPEELTEAPIENNKQPDKGDGMAYTSEAIPVDVNIWQYIEGICCDQLDAIERDCGVTLTADEHGDVIMVTIGSNDEGRDSVARWRFIELHSDVMSRVVVEICKPLPQLYDSADLKAARKRVQDTFRDNVIVKAERGRYIFIGEVGIAKNARRRFMEWAQLPQASWPTTNQRHHDNPVRPKQTTPQLDISLERLKDKTTELSVPDLPQKNMDNSCDIDASQPHRPDREISMPASNKRIIFEFPEKPSRESELGRLQKAVFKIVSDEPQAVTLSKLDNGPTALHNVDVLSAVEPVDHPESRGTQRLREQSSHCARQAMTGDHADNRDKSNSGVATHESEASGSEVDVSDVRNELLGSEHMPDLEPISSDEEFVSDADGVYMVNKECVYGELSGNGRLPENTVELCPDETHNDDVGLGKNTVMSTDANTASTRQTIGMEDAPVDNEVGSQHMMSLPTGDVRVPERHTNTADSYEVAGNKAPAMVNALRGAPSVERSGYNTRIATEENECIASSGKESKHRQQTPSRYSPNGNERIGVTSTEEGPGHHENMHSIAAPIRDQYSRFSCLGNLGKGSSAGTTDDISPCYPDTSTRQDMIQHLLAKNDPRLMPQLQKLMDIADGNTGIDFRDSSMKGLGMSRGRFVLFDNGRGTAGLNNRSIERARNVGLYEESHLDDPLSCELRGNPDEMKLNVAGCFLRLKVYASSGATPKRLPDAQKVSTECTPDDQDVSAIVTLKQPVGGTVSKLVDDKADLPGYQQVGVILITYDFPSGILTVGNDGTCLIWALHTYVEMVGHYIITWNISERNSNVMYEIKIKVN